MEGWLPRQRHEGCLASIQMPSRSGFESRLAPQFNKKGEVMPLRRQFSELPVELRNVARALMEDLVLHGQVGAGFSLETVSRLLKLDKKSLATLKANITRSAIKKR